VRRARRVLAEAAERQGLRIAAAGTHPFSHWRDQAVTEKPRYRNLAEDYQQVFREQVVFGCHVHVGFDDREAAIQTMNRTRPWLPVLVALAGNSPYWLGADTGYASYRTEVWNRWPTAGMPIPSPPGPTTTRWWRRWSPPAACGSRPSSTGTCAPRPGSRRSSSGSRTCAWAWTRPSWWRAWSGR
jgi:gamma-glutamyl:cysteine ligase YbdK (ATP-grasp superfamily)